MEVAVGYSRAPKLGKEVTDKMNRLLIPLDLSGAHETLIDTLRELRWGPAATLLHVIEEIRDVSDAEIENFYRSLETRAMPMLREVARELEKAGLTCEIEIRRGRRGEEIVRAAVETRADVIILVSHPVERRGVRLGTTSHQVALTAPCSVFLLRPGAPKALPV